MSDRRKKHMMMTRMETPGEIEVAVNNRPDNCDAEVVMRFHSESWRKANRATMLGVAIKVLQTMLEEMGVHEIQVQLNDLELKEWKEEL